MARTLEYYLALPWSYRFEWSNEDQCYIASIAELKGCITDGATIEEATIMIRDALQSYISSLLEDNEYIPEPPKPNDFKGNIPYRTTPAKHLKLYIKANATGKSINKLIDEAVDNLLTG